MPNILLQQLENALPAGMQIPEELRQLYQWIEDNGYYEDRDDGVRYGYLYPKNPFRNTYLDDVNVDIDIAFYMEEENFRKELLTISFGKNADDAAIGVFEPCFAPVNNSVFDTTTAHDDRDGSCNGDNDGDA